MQVPPAEQAGPGVVGVVVVVEVAVAVGVGAGVGELPVLFGPTPISVTFVWIVTLVLLTPSDTK